MKNIIILTSGLSGSSVVTHLVSRAGYWTGESTCEKVDYNTYENSQLVYLNDLLLKAVGYDKDYSIVVKPEKFLEVEQLIDTLDLLPFKAFLAECNQSEPWLWKDPRLWVTLPFWMHLLEPDSFKVVVVDRSISQRWISELLRRNIQTFQYCSLYNNKIKSIISSFLERYDLDGCEVLFDDLIQEPEKVLLKLNQFIGSSLSVEDLRAIYNKPLYKKARGVKSLCLAVVIYLKNYRLRLR